MRALVFVPLFLSLSFGCVAGSEEDLLDDGESSDISTAERECVLSCTDQGGELSVCLDECDESNGPPPAAAELECDDSGKCIYDSVDQLAEELATIFPRDGVVLRGKTSNGIASCIVTRGLEIRDSWMEDYLYIGAKRENSLDDEVRFNPTNEGDYWTSKLTRENIEGGVRYTDLRANTDRDFEMVLRYDDDGSISSVMVKALGEFYAEAAECIDLAPVYE